MSGFNNGLGVHAPRVIIIEIENVRTFRAVYACFRVFPKDPAYPRSDNSKGKSKRTIPPLLRPPLNWENEKTMGLGFSRFYHKTRLGREIYSFRTGTGHLWTSDR